MKIWEIQQNGKVISANIESGKMFVILPCGKRQPVVNNYMACLVAELNGFDTILIPN